jgi:hypothetical protein
LTVEAKAELEARAERSSQKANESILQLRSRGEAVTAASLELSLNAALKAIGSTNDMDDDNNDRGSHNLVETQVDADTRVRIQGIEDITSDERDSHEQKYSDNNTDDNNDSSDDHSEDRRDDEKSHDESREQDDDDSDDRESTVDSTLNLDWHRSSDSDSDSDNSDDSDNDVKADSVKDTGTKIGL